MSSVCLALASFIFLFSFEAWMTAEHEKVCSHLKIIHLFFVIAVISFLSCSFLLQQGHRQDLLTDTFWLMIFFESASLIGSQALANLLVTDLEKGFFFPSAPAALLSLISILYIRKKWNGHKHFSSLRDYWDSFSMNILRGMTSAFFNFPIYFLKYYEFRFLGYLFYKYPEFWEPSAFLIRVQTLLSRSMQAAICSYFVFFL